MKNIHNAARPRARAALTFVAAITALVSVTACSSSGKKYTIPESLCGIDISRDVLEPLLQKGETLTEHPESSGSTKRCRIHVDGQSVLSASTERWADDTTARDVAQSALAVDPQDQQSDQGGFIYSPTGAVGKVNCAKAEAAHEPLWASVRVTHDDAKAEDMLKLIEAYAEAVGASEQCAG
ncbi:hypothetical protein I2W78_09640 [Streptomyces spinoverrucosus]|uniref:hypothetical protein n=1 Tax=Streptomyces spinoverrucosus TaxID=284043 RepID=UPI0018C3AC08|nr:hypothetical protein [Streptomyces spinoverrucosus]MBG0852096.1 hypothetical protein [Streptomyces spinoverrucosus]